MFRVGANTATCQSSILPPTFICWSVCFRTGPRTFVPDHIRQFPPLPLSQTGFPLPPATFRSLSQWGNLLYNGAIEPVACRALPPSTSRVHLPSHLFTVDVGDTCSSVRCVPAFFCQCFHSTHSHLRRLCSFATHLVSLTLLIPFFMGAMFPLSCLWSIPGDSLMETSLHQCRKAAGVHSHAASSCCHRPLLLPLP